MFSEDYHNQYAILFVHFVHNFSVVSDYLVQTSLPSVIDYLSLAHESVFPLPSSFQRFEALFPDDGFKVVFELVNMLG